MTWPSGGPDDPGRDGPDPGVTQPYQGSYPTSPFDRPATGDPGPYLDPTAPGHPVTPGHPATPAHAAWQGNPGTPYGPANSGGPPYDPASGGPGWPGGSGTPYGPGATGAPGWAGGPPPRAGRGGLIIGLVAAGLVVALGVVLAVVLLGDRTGDPTAGPTTPATTTAPPTSVRVARPDPVVPGWQVAVSGKRQLAYDVPADWTVLGEETVIGFDDGAGTPKVGMSGAATHQDGYCAEASSSWRAATGFSGYTDTDLALVATDAVTKWGRFGYLGPAQEEPAVSVGAPSRVTVDGVAGTYVRAAVRPTAPAPCAAPSAVVHALALPADEGSFVFVVVSDQEVPGALTDADILKIINTVRSTT